MQHLLRTSVSIAAALTIFALTTSSASAQFGTLKGRFVWKGKPFVAAKANVPPGVAFCGKFNIKEYVPQIGPKGGVGGLLVWMYLPKNAPAPKIKPGEVPGPMPVLDNLQCSFVPRATLVRTGRDFKVTNSDNTPHSVNPTFLENRAQAGNVNLPPNAFKLYNLPKRERIPIPVTCGFHPWMKSYLIVTDHPYAVLTKPDGTFEMELPIGLNEIQVRHFVGNGGYVDVVKYQGKVVNWGKGKIGQIVVGGQNKVGIPAGKVVDLGDIEIQPVVFED